MVRTADPTGVVMKIELSCGYEFQAAEMTTRVSRVMDHFGVGKEIERHVVAEGLMLDVEDGDIVAFTGDSGSGKSSLMRELATQFEGVLWFDDIEFVEGAVIDQFDGDWAESMAILSACGLGEAQVMLRRPGELSDGQRMRLKIALGIAQNPVWLVIDEFTSSLDRALAKVIAFNLKKLSVRHHIGILVATTHEDMLEDLSPAVWVRMGIDGEIEVSTQREGEVCAEKKSDRGSVLRMRSGSVKGPVATGRTLLAGITDPIRSGARRGSTYSGMEEKRSNQNRITAKHPSSGLADSATFSPREKEQERKRLGCA